MKTGVKDQNRGYREVNQRCPATYYSKPHQFPEAVFSDYPFHDSISLAALVFLAFFT